jgi:hypothetical protein
MPDELDRDDVQAETGFGTGLRAHILGRHGDEDELGEPAVAPAATAPAPEPDPAATELEVMRVRLDRHEAALADRERSLSVQAAALAAEAKRLAEQKAELEQHLNVRDLLRQRAEREVERLWRAFDDALEATRAGGEPDYEIRLSAARALLAEAYAVPGEAAEPGAELPDELAVLRDRKVHQT